MILYYLSALELVSLFLLLSIPQQVQDYQTIATFVCATTVVRAQKSSRERFTTVEHIRRA